MDSSRCSTFSLNFKAVLLVIQKTLEFFGKETSTAINLNETIIHRYTLLSENINALKNALFHTLHG